MGALRRRLITHTAAVLSATFASMRKDVQARHDDGAKRLVPVSWDADLAGVVLDRHMATASDVAQRVSDALDNDYDPEVMRAWLAMNAQFMAAGTNAMIEQMLADADADEEDDDPVGHVFDIQESSGSDSAAQRMVTCAAGFAAHDAARAAGAASKSWRVNSGNPRSSHARLDGETVGMDESFSNGMNCPGDPDGGADENAQCECSLTILK